MILFNKAMLAQFEFPFPMFLTTWHMLVATCLTQLLSKTTDMLPGVKESKIGPAELKTKILPVAFFFAVSLVLSNKAYIFLSVSYIQMLKACTPVAVLIFSFVAGLENPSYIEVYIVILISIGVAMTSVGETYFSIIGFTFQTLGILAESARLVLTNALMKQLKLDSLSSLYYIAPMCLAFIFPAMLVFEVSELPWDRIFSGSFGLILVANGAIAFLLNVAVVMLIGNTSALVLTLAGIIKDLMLVCLSIVVFGSPVTLLQYLGYFIALVGLNLHKQYKKSPQKVSEHLTYLATCGSLKVANEKKQDTDVSMSALDESSNNKA